MSDNGSAAAVAALFSAGILLLNLGVGMVQTGDTINGLMVILFGVVLIFAAIFVAKTMMQTIARRVKSPS
jgi:hypothetical protein